MGDPGRCVVCSADTEKRQVLRHLESCPGQSRNGKDRVFWILVDGGGPFWMHVQLRRAGRLKDLDAFLRRTWLECCGHMSAFTIDGRRIGSGKMGAPISDVLRFGLKFSYEYDFGTTTTLELKVLTEEQAEPTRESVRLLARNSLPELNCTECKKAGAGKVCTQCLCESGEGFLCKKCAKSHECGEEMLLPVVNSPRMGMCGYTGEE